MIGTVILFLILLYLFQTMLLLLLEYKRPEKAAVWIFISFCLPLIGIWLYRIAGRPYGKSVSMTSEERMVWNEMHSQISGKVSRVTSIEGMKNEDFAHNLRLYNLLSEIPNSTITSCNHTDYYAEGDPLFTALYQDLKEAKEHIHLEFYIIRHDIMGTIFQDLLIKKSLEGVQVRIICDGFGSKSLSKPFIQRMKDAGVEVHFFLPPLHALKLRKINYRNHRKIVVIDGKIGYTGGMNIGDEYKGESLKLGFWRDTHMRMHGDAVYYLQMAFIKDWRLVSGQTLRSSLVPVLFPEHHCKGTEQIQVIASGPDETRHPIQEMCFNAIATAHSKVYITTPYFIPDVALMTAIKTAARSGVDVRVLIPGRADYKIVLLASLSHLEELMEAGVTFYRYQKGFVHAKVVIVDQLLAAVGSANLDMRSFYSNFELTAVMYSRRALDQLTADFEHDLQNSKQIELSEFKQRSRASKCAEVVCRLLSPLL
ncbi:cardiolipin synthase [Paenibacillus polygoni]|uniref:Cardiolipin synthase n=1 Tax=Paenibacillus polygoni TaxID=3050112 RepID=A0ABY8X7D8_9BACL|nr:cardiolipin synthase [Paenibacillus polygoni]WIV20108.1 cardiolipin synthase [Paenibacillus polygoni]